MQRQLLTTTSLFLTAHTATAESEFICDATVLPDCVAENKVCSDGLPMSTYALSTDAETGVQDCACNACGNPAAEVCDCTVDAAQEIFDDGETTCATLCPGEPTPGPTKSTDDSDDSGDSGDLGDSSASFVSISMTALVSAAVAFVF